MPSGERRVEHAQLLRVVIAVRVEQVFAVTVPVEVSEPEVPVREADHARIAVCRLSELAGAVALGHVQRKGVRAVAAGDGVDPHFVRESIAAHVTVDYLAVRGDLERVPALRPVRARSSRPPCCRPARSGRCRRRHRCRPGRAAPCSAPAAARCSTRRSAPRHSGPRPAMSTGGSLPASGTGALLLAAPAPRPAAALPRPWWPAYLNVPHSASAPATHAIRRARPPAMRLGYIAL